MRLELAAEPAIIKIEPIKISYISLKLTCKEMTAEKNIKCLLFSAMKSLCFYKSRKLCIYNKDPAMQSPPHLNLSQAASGSLCSKKACTMDAKSTCMLCVSKQGYSQVAECNQVSTPRETTYSLRILF